MQPFLIGIAGPSGAGKSTVSHFIQERYGAALSLNLDNYYKEQEAFPERDGIPNWDLPHDLDFTLLASHLRTLKEGKPSPIRVYDPRTGSRYLQEAAPAPLIIVDGFLLLYDAGVRDLLDLKLFLDIPEDVQLARRFKRQWEPGMDAEALRTYLSDVVLKNYALYGAPTKAYADAVIRSDRDKEEVHREVAETLERALPKALS